LSTSSTTYLKLAEHYQKCLKKHGDSSVGMDWPSEKDNLQRFGVMTELFEAATLSSENCIRLLDFGCGTSHFYDFLLAKGLAEQISYTGIDIVPESINISRVKFPGNKYLCLDILESTKSLGFYDYITINGLFTQKQSMTEREMCNFLVNVLDRLYPCFTKGLAFNTMSGQVDFKKAGSFHVDLDWVAKMFAKKFTRNFMIRHDYGLYENTFYLFKKENTSYE
jgi:SAM-dependent methyltransferase